MSASRRHPPIPDPARDPGVLIGACPLWLRLALPIAVAVAFAVILWFLQADKSDSANPTPSLPLAAAGGVRVDCKSFDGAVYSKWVNAMGFAPREDEILKAQAKIESLPEGCIKEAYREISNDSLRRDRKRAADDSMLDQIPSVKP